VQQQKTPAKVEFAKRWTNATGESITPGTLMKKLHNLKSRTIQKSDMNKTGNRKVRLADWEILLLGHLKLDSNPSVLLTFVWSIPMSSATPFWNPGSAMLPFIEETRAFVVLGLVRHPDSQSFLL
jgi:hypothetical protein